MKLKKILAAAVLLAGSMATMTACGSSVITIWVGEESATFYQEKCDSYVESHPDFKYKIKVVGTDTGSAGGAMTTDASACGDIITVAHDNIGKLVEKGLVMPIYDENLINQVAADNPTSYQSVVNVTYNGSKRLYGVPYISQALFLYYNKNKVSSTQASTFEGLMEAAATNGSSTKAFTVTDMDGYNYSFNLLAVNNSTKATTMKIYKDLVKGDCYAQGPDSVANLHWAQRVFNDDNGGLLPTSNGWASDIKSGKVLSVIGGAWHYDAFVSAVGGTNNMGIGLIPTYTLTSQDVAGVSDDIAAGTVMRGGTYADCKCFLINFSASEAKYKSMEEIISYLSSKEMQMESFEVCKNVPAYDGAVDNIEVIKDQLEPTVYNLAYNQLAMVQYGIPQPFCTGTLNSYYYSMGAPDYYKNAIINADGAFDTTRSLREILYEMEYIWQKGKAPSEIPTVLPEDVPA